MKAGYFADVRGVVKKVDADKSVTLDFGGGHCVTFTESQAKAFIKATQEKAPEPELAPESPKEEGAAHKEVTASEVGGLKDGNK